METRTIINNYNNTSISDDSVLTSPICQENRYLKLLKRYAVFYIIFLYIYRMSRGDLTNVMNPVLQLLYFLFFCFYD